jgi:hypothetical protein
MSLVKEFTKVKDYMYTFWLKWLQYFFLSILGFTIKTFCVMFVSAYYTNILNGESYKTKQEMKSIIFWDMMPCSPLSCTRRSSEASGAT